MVAGEGTTEVAAAAAPRPGQGESALIEAVPAPARTAQQAPPGSGQPAPALPAPQAAGEAPALGSGLKLWNVAPIRWGGYVAADFQRVTAQGQPKQAQTVESLNLRANSYIWQPWFAQVSGELGLFRTQEHGGQTTPGLSGSGGRGSSSAVLSGGQLALFPVSRFPFTASYSETDTRTSGELTNTPYSSRRYGLTQTYSPLEGRASYRLSYNRSDLISDAFGTDKAKAVSGSMNWGNAFHTLSLNGNRYTNTRSNSDDSSSLNTLNGTHAYRPIPGFSADSLINYSRSEYRLTNASLPTDLHSRLLQLNSFLTWRPAQDSPLLLTGGARLFQSNTGANGAEAEVTTLGANAGASYAFNRNVSVNGGGTVTQVSSPGTENVYTEENGGIDYNSDARKLGEYSYSWNSGANAANQTGAGNDRQRIGARIGHRINRSIALAQGSNVFFTAGQDYSAIHDSVVSTSQTLRHTAATSWNRTSGDGGTTMLGLDVADNRTTGYAAQHFQLANLQANGQVQLSRWASAAANMTVQATRQTASPAFATGGSGSGDRSTVTTGGNLTYQHLRAFDVPRLRYYALFNANQYQERTRLEGDINAPLEHVNWSFEQRLEYSIGRLETRLSVRFAEIAGRNNGMIFFRVLRQFGQL